MKKGKFSLIVALVLLGVGVLMVLLGTLGMLGVLPDDLSRLSLAMAYYVSLSGRNLLDAGIFLLLEAILILAFRQRRPFSSFLVYYLVPCYLTLMAAVRRVNGTELQNFFPDAVKMTKPGLLFILFVLELLLASVLLAAVSGLDEKWRKKQELKVRLLEKEGLLQTKEMREEEKLLKKERKRKEHQDRLQAKEDAKYERERAKAAEKEEERARRQAEKERKEYEKAREKEELRREAREAKEQKKILRQQDKENEKLELALAKEAARNEKVEKERLQEEIRRKKEEEDERRRQEEEEIGPEPEYPRGYSNPDAPLEFPSFDPMPHLSSLFHGDEEEEDEEPESLPEPESRPQIDNRSFLESLQRELVVEEEEEEKNKPEPRMETKRFKGGGMLESVLESYNNDVPETARPQRPIIGLGEEESRENPPSSSIAPSGLSPDHPRYKMFEALQRGEHLSQPEIQRKEEEKETPAPSYLSPDHPRYKMFESLNRAPEKPVAPQPEKEEDVAPSGLSPDHPRYKLFEALKNNTTPKEEEKKSDVEEGIAPSGLSPDHPRYRLFQSLRRSNEVPQEESGVTHFPGRSFQPEDPPREIPHAYGDVTRIEEPPVEEPASSGEETAKDKLLERIGQSLERRPESVVAPDPVVEPAPEPEPEPEPAPEPRSFIPAQPVAAPAVEDEEDEDDIEVEIEDEEESYVPPTAPEIRSVKTAEDGHKVIQVKSDEDQEEDFELSVGVGDLASNRAGYTAIKLRQEALYTAPDTALLKDYPGLSQEIDPETYAAGQVIVQTLADQHISVDISAIVKGPTVTMYELELAQGVIISRIRAREDELNYALGGKKIRIQAPIPGKRAVGIEVPNSKTAMVGFKDMIYSLRANEKYMDMKVPMILGKTITGEPIVIDVAKMPHMIIAGTTGSGKSVCISTFINTIIFQKGPKDVRLMMVDPKMVELSMYNGIPHLLTPVIIDAKRAIKALDWLVSEMERRYAMLSKYSVRNIEGLNDKIRNGSVKNVEKLPYIVLIMDEFADIVSVVGKEMDIAISRIAAKARAAGIHMILATQRPSADVVTGTLKSNLPGRIAFAVSSGINSKVILDEMGAENLLGKGDMLLLNPAAMGLQRIQGAFLSDGEVESISEYAREHNPAAQYLEESLFEEEEMSDDPMSVDEFGDEDGNDSVYAMAKQIVFERKGASASYLQRRLKIGYNRAARYVEMMEEEGIVGPANGSKPREVLKFE